MKTSDSPGWKRGREKWKFEHKKVKEIFWEYSTAFKRQVFNISKVGVRRKGA
jgi:hypothetical protein